jgi:hypothetical protein
MPMRQQITPTGCGNPSGMLQPPGIRWAGMAVPAPPHNASKLWHRCYWSLGRLSAASWRLSSRPCRTLRSSVPCAYLRTCYVSTLTRREAHGHQWMTSWYPIFSCDPPISCDPATAMQEWLTGSKCNTHSQVTSAAIINQGVRR